MPPIPFKQFLTKLALKAKRTVVKKPPTPSTQFELPGIEPKPPPAPRLGSELKKVRGNKFTVVSDPKAKYVSIQGEIGGLTKTVGRFSYEIHDVGVRDVENFIYDDVGVNGQDAIHDILDDLDRFYGIGTRSIRFYLIKDFRVEDRFRNSNATFKILKTAIQSMIKKKPAVVIFSISAQDHERQAALIRWYRQLGFNVYHDIEDGSSTAMEIFY